MIVYLTFSDPESWLTVAPLTRLLEQHSVEVEVRPMLGSLGNVVSKAKAGEDDPLAEYKARRAVARQKAGAREQERIAEMLGISVEQVCRNIDPMLLSLGLLWLNQADGDWVSYCHAAFQQAFEAGADVESAAAVGTLLEQTGVSADGFVQFVDAEQAGLLKQTDELLEQGLLSAPAFVVDDEIFHGREHLPLISWMLAGRVGTPPV